MKFDNEEKMQYFAFKFDEPQPDGRPTEAYVLQMLAVSMYIIVFIFMLFTTIIDPFGN